MKRTLLVTATILLVAPAALAAEPMQQDNAQVNYKDDGGYTAEKSADQVDTNGVKHKADSKTVVDYDSNGNMKRTVTTTDKVKNGMHSKENSSATEFKQTNDGGYDKTTTTEHTNTDGTNLKSTSNTHASVDAKGNDVTVTKTQNTVDPPGLMNKTTTTNTTKTVNGVVVEDQTKN
jgi:hypothetical protein